MELSAVSKLRPVGYTTIHMALSKLSEAMSIDSSIENGSHSTAYEPAADIFEKQIEVLREALFHGKITAYHYHEDLLEQIPAGTWRNIETELWIQDGEHLSKTGRSETLLIEEESFNRFIASPHQSVGGANNSTCFAFFEGKSFYVSPFIALMIEAILKFDIPNKSVKQETLAGYFENQTLPNGTPISKNHARNLATFCRPAELMKGGLRAAHPKGKGFNPKG